MLWDSTREILNYKTTNTNLPRSMSAIRNHISVRSTRSDHHSQKKKVSNLICLVFLMKTVSRMMTIIMMMVAVRIVRIVRIALTALLKIGKIEREVIRNK